MRYIQTAARRFTVSRLRVSSEGAEAEQPSDLRPGSLLVWILRTDQSQAEAPGAALF
jgi:hypothetical protein